MSQNNFIYFYSKYSQSCNKILPVINMITPHVNLTAVDIDNIQIRNYLLDKRIFHTVPCILLSYPTEGRIELYEGNDVLEFINKILRMLNKPSIQAFLNLPSAKPNIPSMRIESQSSKINVHNGKTMLTDDIVDTGKPIPKVNGKSSSAVKISDPFEEEKEMDQLANTESSENFRNMYTDRMSSNLNIKKGEGHDNMNSSLSKIEQNKTDIVSDILSDSNESSSMINPLDDDEDNSLLIQPTKINMNDLVGPGGGNIISKETEAKSEKIKSTAQELLRERELMDAKYNKGRK
jgi:hypothetical protein